MVMQSYYPDYNRISEIKQGLEEALWDNDEGERYNKLQKELQELTSGGGVVAGKACCDPLCDGHFRDSNVYYPGKIHHLDGDTNNESFGNLAMVCPKCRTHILLSRFSPEDIWLLKVKGLNNAQIARYLGISRERVRQLYKKARSFKEKVNMSELVRIAQSGQRTDEEEVKLKAGLDKLVRQAQNMEKSLLGRYSHYEDDDGFPSNKNQKQRSTDKRTLRKRILAELVKPGKNQTKEGIK